MMYKNEDDYIIFAIDKDADAILFNILDQHKGKDCKEINTTINVLLNGIMGHIPQINYTIIAKTEDEDLFFIFIDCNGTELNEEEILNHFQKMFTDRNNWMKGYIIPDSVNEYQGNNKKTCNQQNKEDSKLKLRKPVYYLLPRLSDILNYQVSGKLCKYEGKYLIQTSVMTNLDDYLERFYPKYPPEIIKTLKLKGETND